MKEEMKKQQIGRQAPAFAIVESNTLAVMGLRQLLESAIPSAQIQAFGTFGELQASNPSISSTFLYLCILYSLIEISS